MSQSRKMTKFEQTKGLLPTIRPPDHEQEMKKNDQRTLDLFIGKLNEMNIKKVSLKKQLKEAVDEDNYRRFEYLYEKAINLSKEDEKIQETLRKLKLEESIFHT